MLVPVQVDTAVVSTTWLYRDLMMMSDLASLIGVTDDIGKVCVCVHVAATPRTLAHQTYYVSKQSR